MSDAQIGIKLIYCINGYNIIDTVTGVARVLCDHILLIPQNPLIVLRNTRWCEQKRTKTS